MGFLITEMVNISRMYPNEFIELRNHNVVLALREAFIEQPSGNLVQF